MSHAHKQPGVVQRLQEFSVPLIAGVVAALLVANAAPDLYHRLVHDPLGGLFSSHHESHNEHGDCEQAGNSSSHGPASVTAVGFVHAVSGNSHEIHEAHGTPDSHGAAVTTAHPEEQEHGHSPWALAFIVNDIFMVFFFGIAAKEITESCLPGGALNPPSKAINPLLGTIGGVLGPIAVFLGLNSMIGQAEWACGWGIPTATDIALAWLVARLLFGPGHPAISFLLLLAIADDAIGLGIIAFAYPDPHNPVQWIQTAWIIPGVAVAAGLRWCNVQNWMPYVFIGGAFCWFALFSAHLHPALALVFVVPLIPGPKRDDGLFQEDMTQSHYSPLEKFEHQLKLPVDFGLFFFAFANAGVSMSGVNNLTWIVLASLMIGKTLGITLFSWVGSKCGFPLPAGIGLKDLVVTAMIAGLGLTVALFVSNQAFADPAMQGAAKMGALLSVLAGVSAWAISKLAGETEFGRWVESGMQRIVRSVVPDSVRIQPARQVVRSSSQSGNSTPFLNALSIDQPPSLGVWVL